MVFFWIFHVRPRLKQNMILFLWAFGSYFYRFNIQGILFNVGVIKFWLNCIIKIILLNDRSCSKEFVFSSNFLTLLLPNVDLKCHQNFAVSFLHHYPAFLYSPQFFLINKIYFLDSGNNHADGFIMPWTKDFNLG